MAKRVVLELSSSTNFVYSLKSPAMPGIFHVNILYSASTVSAVRVLT